jgi:DNA-binding HxlR family transcriptional regulator
MPQGVRQVADLLERRWSLSIIWASAEGGAVRFNEFRQVLGPVPPRTLALRLSELEQAGVLERVIVDARPPRAEYRLTEAGARLKAVVAAMRRVSEPV